MEKRDTRFGGINLLSLYNLLREQFRNSEDCTIFMETVRDKYVRTTEEQDKGFIWLRNDTYVDKVLQMG